MHESPDLLGELKKNPPRGWERFAREYSSLVYDAIGRLVDDRDERVDAYLFVMEKLGERDGRRLLLYSGGSGEIRCSFESWLRVVVQPAGGADPREGLHQMVVQRGWRLREIGREYGATTGRPRRCGWFDAVAGRYAARVNGVHFIALTKLDVLDELDEIRIAVAYRLPGGGTLDAPPADADLLGRVEPVYETLPGWRSSTR